MASLDVRLRSRLRAFALDVALTVGSETLSLAGPSGAGKTTVLRMVAGLARPDAGRIAAGEDVWLDTAAGIDRRPERRGVGLVPQDYALFPHLSVAANVGFADPARAPELMERLGIAHLAADRPARLSGGERQRVALARALARRPAVLLLDEPLAALDAQTRRAVRGELAAVLADLAVPAVLVTHDFHDAATLAQRVAVLVDGEIRQAGTPGELVAAPADPFVAAFTGANVLHGMGEGEHVALDGGGALRVAARATGRVAVAFPVWDVAFGGEPGAAPRALSAATPQPGIPARVLSTTALGPRTRVVTDRFVAEVDGPGPEPGALVAGVVDPARLHVFAA